MPCILYEKSSDFARGILTFTPWLHPDNKRSCIFLIALFLGVLVICEPPFGWTQVDKAIKFSKPLSMSMKRKKGSESIPPGSQKRLRLNEWLSDADSDEESFRNKDQENSEDDVATDEDSQEENESHEIHFLRSESPENDTVLVERISLSGKEKRLPKGQSSTPIITTDSVETSASTIPIEGLNFAQLGVLPALVASLNSMSIRRPTPVQAACIPPLLQGKINSLAHDRF
jgi:hypothetical protein